MRKLSPVLGLLTLYVGLLVLELFNPAAAQARAGFYSAYPFLKVWERTDYPVATGQVTRSWYWGPAPFQLTEEAYAQTPGGQRLVHYFDKGRMEITQPGVDLESRWYISNGLLVKEMVSGALQLGDNTFEPRQPALLPISGDSLNPLSPTYATFGNLTTRRPAVTGAVTTQLSANGELSEAADLAKRFPSTAPAYYEPTLGHNIPTVFWRFLNQRGPVMKDRQLVQDVLEDWLFSFGLPLTEAYWTRSVIGGVEREVLVQLFERRVLTYTPANAPGYEVETGNVGRHYYAWRYGGATSSAPAYSQPALRLVIPAVGIDAAIEYVSYEPDKSMQTPRNPLNVGWFRYSAQPGEVGNAVIAGHLDWYTIGPAVFWKLNNLRPGDLIYVVSALGNRQTFKVTELATYSPDDYPANKIFGEAETANLNLITCNGAFDRNIRSYTRRLVVYSTLVS